MGTHFLGEYGVLRMRSRRGMKGIRVMGMDSCTQRHMCENRGQGAFRC